MSDLEKRAVLFATGALARLADPEKAAGMQAYMKTDMPFYGVQKPGRAPILKQIASWFPPADRDEYERLVLAFWDLPHREEKYLALGLARHFEGFVVPASLPLYDRLIVEGAWWDLVDDVATGPLRTLVSRSPGETWPVLDGWIDDEDMWRRRSAIICQVGLKDATDSSRLFGFCQARMHEKEFFIRKAIGWALREHAKTDPDAVAAFARAHRDGLSGLSYREATKHIGDLL